MTDRQLTEKHQAWEQGTGLDSEPLGTGCWSLGDLPGRAQRINSRRLCGFCRLQQTPEASAVRPPQASQPGSQSLGRSNLLTKGLNAPTKEGK